MDEKGGRRQVRRQVLQANQARRLKHCLKGGRDTPDILAQERAAAGRVSEMIFNTVEAETQSLVRKVGLNPNVYTGYNYLKTRGNLHEEDDLRDFTNYCIKVAMAKLLGAGSARAFT